ncbi:hypothetical protein GCM10010495_72800 [Kitasatospora herbaricolor]|nr:hypothetical protein GCM10010495_72800 [Kitasatospora herbaricolor]
MAAARVVRTVLRITVLMTYSCCCVVKMMEATGPLPAFGRTQASTGALARASDFPGGLPRGDHKLSHPTDSPGTRRRAARAAPGATGPAPCPFCVT